jgi:hypothetical protein
MLHLEYVRMRQRPCSYQRTRHGVHHHFNRNY